MKVPIFERRWPSVVTETGHRIDAAPTRSPFRPFRPFQRFLCRYRLEQRFKLALFR